MSPWTLDQAQQDANAIRGDIRQFLPNFPPTYVGPMFIRTWKVAVVLASDRQDHVEQLEDEILEPFDRNYELISISRDLLDPSPPVAQSPVGVGSPVVRNGQASSLTWVASDEATGVASGHAPHNGPVMIGGCLTPVIRSARDVARVSLSGVNAAHRSWNNRYVRQLRHVSAHDEVIEAAEENRVVRIARGSELVDAKLRGILLQPSSTTVWWWPDACMLVQTKHKQLQDGDRGALVMQRRPKDRSFEGIGMVLGGSTDRRWAVVQPADLDWNRRP